jgi:hypothetical protein
MKRKAYKKRMFIRAKEICIECSMDPHIVDPDEIKRIESRKEINALAHSIARDCLEYAIKNKDLRIHNYGGYKCS